MRTRVPSLFVPALLLLLGIAPASTDEAVAGDTTYYFDIKPEECPNPVTPDWGAAGSLGAETALLGTDDTPAMAFNASSIILVLPGGGGLGEPPPLTPIATSLSDVSTPFVGPDSCGCTTAGADGTEDLVVRFDPGEVYELLQVFPPGSEVELCVEGQLVDGTPFTACDCVFLIQPLPVAESSWGRIKSTYRDTSD